MYIGRAWLHYTDEQTLSLTPRQFRMQLSTHEYVTKKMYGTDKEDNNKNNAQVGYIDQIPGW